MATQCCLKPNEPSLVCIEKCLQLTLFVKYTCKPYLIKPSPEEGSDKKKYAFTMICDDHQFKGQLL